MLSSLRSNVVASTLGAATETVKRFDAPDPEDPFVSLWSKLVASKIEAASNVGETSLTVNVTLPDYSYDVPIGDLVVDDQPIDNLPINHSVRLQIAAMGKYRFRPDAQVTSSNRHGYQVSGHFEPADNPPGFGSWLKATNESIYQLNPFAQLAATELLTQFKLDALQSFCSLWMSHHDVPVTIQQNTHGGGGGLTLFWSWADADATSSYSVLFTDAKKRTRDASSAWDTLAASLINNSKKNKNQ